MPDPCTCHLYCGGGKEIAPRTYRAHERFRIFDADHPNWWTRDDPALQIALQELVALHKLELAREADQAEGSDVCTVMSCMG
jgi:hypothetical protein